MSTAVLGLDARKTLCAARLGRLGGGVTGSVGEDGVCHTFGHTFGQNDPVRSKDELFLEATMAGDVLASDRAVLELNAGGRVEVPYTQGHGVSLRVEVELELEEDCPSPLGVLPGSVQVLLDGKPFEPVDGIRLEEAEFRLVKDFEIGVTFSTGETEDWQLRPASGTGTLSFERLTVVFPYATPSSPLCTQFPRPSKAQSKDFVLTFEHTYEQGVTDPGQLLSFVPGTCLLA